MCINLNIKVFLKVFMDKFNFYLKLINWVLECISSAYASMLVNDNPLSEFKLEKDLRHETLYHHFFLFLIAAKTISIMMNRAMEKDLYVLVEIGVNKIKISHLQFADDSLFVGKMSCDNTRSLKRFLLIFELIESLKIIWRNDACMG